MFGGGVVFNIIGFRKSTRRVLPRVRDKLSLVWDLADCVAGSVLYQDPQVTSLGWRPASVAGVMMKCKLGEHRLPEEWLKFLSWISKRCMDCVHYTVCAGSALGSQSPCIRVHGEHKTKGEIQWSLTIKWWPWPKAKSKLYSGREST